MIVDSSVLLRSVLPRFLRSPECITRLDLCAYDDTDLHTQGVLMYLSHEAP